MSEVPPWGCPWHGLIRDGQLELPNGESMAFPQTFANGNTALIAVPGVPEVERTAEEAADDAQSGRQWWNKAILSANRIHGRPLPSRDSWLYVDDAGDLWLVSTSFSSGLVSGGTTTVTLRRFGVLGGAVIEHSYSVSVPNMGQDTPSISGSLNSTPTVRKYHSSPTGNAAVFEISLAFGASSPGATDNNRFWQYRPCGWVEVRLSGLGSECSISVEVLKTREQTLGSTYFEPLERTVEVYYLVDPEGSGPIYISTEPPTGPVSAAYDLVAHDIYDGATGRSGFADYIVGMWYDEGGVLHEVSAFRHEESSRTSEPLEHIGATSFPSGASVDGEFRSTQTTLLTFRQGFCIDGIEVDAKQYSAHEVTTSTVLMDNLYGTSESTVTVTFSPGTTYSDTTSYARYMIPEGMYLGGERYAAQTGALAPGNIPSFLMRSRLWALTDLGPEQAPGRWDFALYRFCDQLYGQVNAYFPAGQQNAPYETQYFYAAEVVSPTGQLTLDPIEVTNSKSTIPGFEVLAYGSWCPVTHRAATDTVPVCFT